MTNNIHPDPDEANTHWDVMMHLLDEVLHKRGYHVPMYVCMYVCMYDMEKPIMNPLVQ
jgi:hypothetical protein